MFFFLKVDIFFNDPENESLNETTLHFSYYSGNDRRYNFSVKAHQSWHHTHHVYFTHGQAIQRT